MQLDRLIPLVIEHLQLAGFACNENHFQNIRGEYNYVNGCHNIGNLHLKVMELVSAGALDQATEAEMDEIDNLAHCIINKAEEEYVNS
jgi:hypothetical protein